MKNEILKICNYNQQHLNYYLSFLGYAMTGDSSLLQEFWCIRGQTASNGKSVIFEALTEIMPSYVVKMESNFFEEKYGSRHKEVAMWKGVRLTWANELSKNKQDETEIKDLSDGTNKRFKVMYGAMDTMPITFKMCFLSNNTLNINADNGIKRRLKMMQFDSEFKPDVEEDNFETRVFKRNSEFGTELRTKYKHALLHLIFRYSKMFVDNCNRMCEYPAEWVNESNDVVNENSKFNEFFDAWFEVGENLSLAKCNVDEILKNYPEKDLNFKDQLKKMRVGYTYNSQERVSGSRVKGMFYGFKIREVVGGV